MAYERDDNRRGGGYSDRNRYEGSQGGGRERYQSSGDNRDGGFIERAGEQIKSWFGDDDRDGRNSGSEPHSGYNQDVRGGRYTDDDGRLGGRDHGAPNYGSPGQQRQGGGNADQDRAQQQRQTNHDPHYASWRQQQIDALDRDYDEYRREHQSKFENDFGGWRTTRQGQRSMVGQVREHMEVHGTDGEKIGTVDKVRGDRIILTKNDPEAGGHHHSIPCSWVQSVDDKVMINKSATEAKTAWHDEDRNSAMFGGRTDNDDRDTRTSGGPHNLNRAFSGTY